MWLYQVQGRMETHEVAPQTMWVWGDSSVSKAPADQAWVPKCNCLHSCKTWAWRGPPVFPALGWQRQEQAWAHCRACLGQKHAPVSVTDPVSKKLRQSKRKRPHTTSSSYAHTWPFHTQTCTHMSTNMSTHKQTLKSGSKNQWITEWMRPPHLLNWNAFEYQ